MIWQSGKWRVNMKLTMDEVRALAAQFTPEGKVNCPRPFGGGHINDTYLVCRDDGTGSQYVLQRINKNVFPDPMAVMDNILRVTHHLRKRIRARGGDPERETLRMLKNNQGEYCVIDRNGDYWRSYSFVADSMSYDRVESADIFCESGHAFGRFMSMLDDFDAASLHETIARFHDTPKRFRDFREAVERDACGRAEGVRDLIETALGYEAFGSELVDALERGELPLRVTHNDTKLNNVLIDETTGRAVCVIDLDTVMPGLCAYDFGDAIRFGASTAAEDEQDLSKVHLDLELYRAYAQGYLSEVADALSDREVDSLAMGAKMMTLENGIRFLGDYLNGDVYFKIHYPEHNLVRARAQFKLLSEMDAHWDEMLACVRELARKG